MWCGFFFFFKQKTAYEMRISDWSSDVCSSDLAGRQFITAFELLPAVLEFVVDELGGFVILRFDRFDLRLTIVIGHCELEPFEALDLFEQLCGDRRAFLHALGCRCRGLDRKSTRLNSSH